VRIRAGPAAPGSARRQRIAPAVFFDFRLEAEPLDLVGELTMSASTFLTVSLSRSSGLDGPVSFFAASRSVYIGHYARA